MGTVYLGEHTLIGRHAAIKVLLRELSWQQDLVTRFFNEARAATAVKHPESSRSMVGRTLLCKDGACTDEGVCGDC